MKNSFSYIKNILKVLIWPIMFIIGQFLIQYVFVLLFSLTEKGNMSESEFINYMESTAYKTKLTNYINSNTLLIVGILFFIFFPILYKKYGKYRRCENKLNASNIIEPILYGIVISLLYNIFVYYLNTMFNFTDRYILSDVPIVVQLISSGIIGPILEELLFRGIVYNKLKEFNSINAAAVICGLIFGFMHSNIIDGLYAFLVNFILIYLYEKYNSLKVTITMHMSLNITIILMLGFIIKRFTMFNLYLFIISFLILLILVNNRGNNKDGVFRKNFRRIRK